VAAFAHAPTRRLLLVQFIFAFLASAAIGWLLYNECFSTVTRAIDQLPAEGEIRSAQLDWRGPSPQMLAEGRLLAVTVDLNHTGGLRSAADLQLEFGRESFRFRSLLGAMDGRYPAGWIIAFNRTTLKPLWGAWRQAFLVGAIAGSIVSLLISWALLAALYSPAVTALGLVTNRDLDLARSWRLAGAALMPGALIMTAAIVSYGLDFIDLVTLMFAFGLHFVVPWVYLFLSLLFVPSAAAGAGVKKNPFGTSSDKRTR
jgi:hypothetical protein